MTCASCGHENAAGGVFCMRCGAPLQQAMGGGPAAAAAPAFGASAQTGVDASRIPIEYGSFWRRFFAALIDGIITQIIVAIPALFVGVALGLAGAASGQDSERMQLLASVIGMLIGFVGGWLYEAGLTASSKQATIGKMALGMVVTDLDGGRISFARATGRYFGKIVSALTLMVGYLMQPFTEKRQALHDILAGTLVVRRQP
jgi:uncharacterized RDD family membrane protein YckC